MYHHLLCLITICESFDSSDFSKALTSNYSKPKRRGIGVKTPPNSSLRFSHNEITPKNTTPCSSSPDRAKIVTVGNPRKNNSILVPV